MGHERVIPLHNMWMFRESAYIEWVTGSAGESVVRPVSTEKMGVVRKSAREVRVEIPSVGAVQKRHG